MTSVLHSAVSAEWHTPPAVVEAARRTMGGIDLDPFSNLRANQIVKASHYFDGRQGDGFIDDWGAVDDPSRVFVNPPGGKFSAYIRRAGKEVTAGGAQLAWWRMIDEYAAGTIEQGLFVCFSLNVFQTAQKWGYPPPCGFSHCIPAARLRYSQPGRQELSAPPHPSALVFVPPKGDPNAAARFRDNFQIFGYVQA